MALKTLRDVLEAPIPAKAVANAFGISARQVRKLRQGRETTVTQVAAYDEQEAHRLRIQSLMDEIQALFDQPIPEVETDAEAEVKIKEFNEKITELRLKIEELEGKWPTPLLEKETNVIFDSVMHDEVMRRMLFSARSEVRRLEPIYQRAMAEFRELTEGRWWITAKEYKEVMGVAPLPKDWPDCWWFGPADEEPSEATVNKMKYARKQLIIKKELAIVRLRKDFDAAIQQAKEAGYNHHMAEATVSAHKHFLERKQKKAAAKSKKGGGDVANPNHSVSNQQLMNELVKTAAGIIRSEM